MPPLVDVIFVNGPLPVCSGSVSFAHLSRSQVRSDHDQLHHHPGVDRGLIPAPSARLRSGGSIEEVVNISKTF